MPIRPSQVLSSSGIQTGDVEATGQVHWMVFTADLDSFQDSPVAVSMCHHLHPGDSHLYSISFS